ncbi:MAG: 2-oxoacid:acceptor oxidoreductase family protein [Candidatus Ratteibacteria bacterium]|nr:2-oxoacid:acceptor oxidoreductase family protein [Candidatus Ratteibacteria bacterium]
MKKMVEIRWHGRGGQGAKTAALLFADSAMSSGKFIQAFPEYGPERMGAPVQSFDRLSDEPITVHCGVTSPDIVAILDPTLMATVDVTAGLTDDGIIIINTPLTPAEIRKEMGISGKKIFTVDASGISKSTLGKEIPNTPMLGALIKVSGLLDIEKVLDDTRKKLEKKFRTKPELIEGNIKAIRRAYEEVRGER